MSSSSTPCVFQPCSQDGTIPMRSYKIKQARLTSQVVGWTNDTKIVNVCETHAAIVDRDRSCCVDQCPIIVSEFSLPAILHRPLPFRLKEGTTHRFLCLGHNLRYIDTLRKPMAASAVSDAINKKEAKGKQKQKEKEEEEAKNEAEEGGDQSASDNGDGGEEVRMDDSEASEEGTAKSEEDVDKMADVDERKERRERRKRPLGGDLKDEMEVDEPPKPEERRSMRVKRAKELAEEEEFAAKRRQAAKEESQQEIWAFDHDSIPTLTLSSVPTTPQKSGISAKLRPRSTRKSYVNTTSPSPSSPVASPLSPFTPPSSSSSPVTPSPVASPTSPPASPDPQVAPKDRRCWFPNCFKADRTIRILRPAQINTCKSHLQKQETLLRLAMTSGKMVLVEGDGKDQVCAICIDYYTTPDHWVCSNESCSFIFCKKCVDFVTRRRSTPKKERWICWACEASSLKGKPKERAHFISLITQQPMPKPSTGRILRNAKESQTTDNQTNNNSNNNNNSSPPSPTPATPTPSTPSNKRNSSPTREHTSDTSDKFSTEKLSPQNTPTPTTSNLTTNYSPSITPTQPPSPVIQPSSDRERDREREKQPIKPKERRKRMPPLVVTLPSNDTNNADNSPTSTSPPTPTSPVPTSDPGVGGVTSQSAMMQYLMSTTLASLRNFTQDNSREDSQRVSSLYECTRQLKNHHADLPFPEYSNIWDHLRDIANLLSSELEASLALHTMTEESKVGNGVEPEGELVQNPELDTEISRIQDFKEIGDQFRFKYKEISWRLKEVTEQVAVLEEARLKDMENVGHRKAVLQTLTSKEISTLEEELNANTREEEEFRIKEKALLEQLRQVRGQLARNDTSRRALQRWLLEMQQKHEGTNEEIMQAEYQAVRQHESVLAQARSVQLISQLVDGMYWLHTRQYGPQMQQNENYIGNKMRSLERGYRLKVGTAFSNKQQGDEAAQHSGMLMIYHKVCLSHEVPRDHLEKPDRLRAAISVIHELRALFPEDLDIFTNPPEVEQRYLYLVHDPRYVNKLRSLIPNSSITPSATPLPTPTSANTTSNPPSPSLPDPPAPPVPPTPEKPSQKPTLIHIDYLLDLEAETQRSSYDPNVSNGPNSPKSEEEEERDPNLYDTFVSPLSLQAAFRAAGAVCEAVDAVMRGGYTRAFCAVRPPGHHVGRMGRTKNVPSQGFCLLNNVAIGAKYALYTTGLERIAIVDFDVHHGNGTQEVLEGDPNFMFFSIHVHDPKKFFYPGTGGECAISECGSCESASGLESFGNVVNVPLRRNATSNTFLAAFSQRIIQGLVKFQPQLILLSAGFDGHRDDPTNGLRLGEEDYHTITKLLKRVAKKCCKGRIVSVLEGGYALEGRNSAFRRSVSAHLKALVQDDDDFEGEDL